jgi:hypothetical protein
MKSYMTRMETYSGDGSSKKRIFEVPNFWLKPYLKKHYAMNISTFLDNYTYDDSDMVYQDARSEDKVHSEWFDYGVVSEKRLSRNNVKKFMSSNEKKAVMIEEDFLAGSEFKEAEMLSEDELKELFDRLKDTDTEPVFATADIAFSYARMMIDWPEYVDVSHFETICCIDAERMFFRLRPVKHDGRTLYWMTSEMHDESVKFARVKRLARIDITTRGLRYEFRRLMKWSKKRKKK